MCENGLGWPDTLDPAQNLVEMSMGDMRLAAPRGNHPGFYAVQRREGVVRQVLDVRRIGERADADAGRPADDMVLLEQGELERADLEARRQVVQHQDRLVVIVCARASEHIGETTFNLLH